MDETPLDVVTTKQAAEMLGKSVDTVNRMVNAGKLVPVFDGPAVIPNGPRFYRRADVEALTT